MAAETTPDEKHWDYELFSCFDDCSLCLCTFCLPCYTLGRNAEYLGEDGAVIGLLYGLGLFAIGPMLRWRIRQRKNIQGSMLADVILHMFCMPCALVQENKELFGSTGSHAGEKIPIAQSMVRQ